MGFLIFIVKSLLILSILLNEEECLNFFICILDDIQELCIDVKFKSLDPMVWRNFIDETIRKEMYDSGTQAAKDYLTAQSLKTDQVSPNLA